MRPFIGITSSFENTGGPAPRERAYLNAAYADAVYAAGGIPLPLVPPRQRDEAILMQILARCDGLVFSGGPDLDPRLYGQARHEKTQIMHERRGTFDLPLFRVAGQRDLPTLSICLGCQIANVACGGKLLQHVDDAPRSVALAHYLEDGGSAFHDVRVEPDSLLARVVGRERFEVNSRHHQLLDPQHIGAPLRVVARAPDGVVEAAEDPTRRFFLAVQWHPEDLADRAEHLALFRALIDAAKRS